jgi:peptide/nickel transport system permease protein
LEVLNSDYLRTARAKGVTERIVVLRHAMPNALIPVITVIGLRLPILFGGAVVIETLFQWPGMGSMALSAANSRDFPLLLALGMLTAAVVVTSSLLADIAYAIVDPRIRYQ